MGEPCSLVFRCWGKEALLHWMSSGHTFSRSMVGKGTCHSKMGRFPKKVMFSVYAGFHGNFNTYQKVSNEFTDISKSFNCCWTLTQHMDATAQEPSPSHFTWMARRFTETRNTMCGVVGVSLQLVMFLSLFKDQRNLLPLPCRVLTFLVPSNVPQ